MTSLLRTNNKGFTAMQLSETLPESRKIEMLQLLLDTALEATKRCLHEDTPPSSYNDLLVKFTIESGSLLALNLKRGLDTYESIQMFITK